MIIYFADRQLNILGQASTELPEGLTITADRKTEDTETGVSVFECKIPFDDETRAKVEACAEVGNYLLRNYDGENELYSIIDAEIDTKKRQVYIYAEDDGMDLLNEVVGVYEADKAYPITHYINKYAAGAGFQIGINEVESLSRKLSWDGEATAAARIASVATQFDGCEISFSFEIDGLYVVNKYINIYKQRGKDNGAQLRLNQDIDSIITSKSIANLATALQCTGGTPEEAETPITLQGYKYDDGDFYVDGTVVKSRKALEKWSRFLWKTEESKKTGGHITKQYSYDTTSQQTLCAHAITELKKIRDVEVNYEVDIKKLPRNVKIGDRVNVIDEKGELYLSTRILQLETSVCEQEYKAVLGEYLIKGSGISQKVADLAAQFAVQAAANAKARAEALRAAKEAEQQAAEAAAKAAKAEADLQAAQEEVNAAKAAALEAQAQAEAAELAAAQARADIADMEADIEIAQSAAEEAVTKAEAARSTAETAKTDADTAKTTAQAAKLDAEKAAQDVANLGGELETLSNTMEADYARKTDLTETESSLQTQISQNAAEISSHASSITRIDETANNAAAQAQTAKNAAEAAQSEADQAAADAAKAQQAANNAATAAQNAQNKADTAKTAAEAAQTAADNAASKAQQAESDLASAKENLAAVTSRMDATEAEVEAAQAAVTAAQAAADKAKQDAAAAQSTADTAKTKATTAQTAADDAKTAADNAQAAADNAQQAADDAQAAVDALAVRVTTAETKITQNSDEIALRAKKTEVAETLAGYYTITETDAAIQVKADSITNTVSETYATKTELAEDAGAAQATANDALSSIATAESVIQQLADSIASLVRDGNGGSLIKQDESGFYYFDISSLETNLSSAANSLLDLEGIVLDINGQIDVLKSTAEALQKRTEYVLSYTDENDRPCLKLGEGDSTYMVYITNTGIRLMDGTAAPSIITRQMLVIEKAMIRNELQIGDDEDTTINGVWLWKRRSNGNLGLSWKGVNS